VVALAISKEQKNELVAQYNEWIDGSRAMIVAQYQGLSMKQLDQLRREVRQVGGEFHVVKNTLSKLAFDAAGLTYAEDLFEGSTAIGFAFQDAPDLAKAMTGFAKDAEFLKVKCGYLGKDSISAAEVQALADLPPLPVVRAQLLGVLMAPANQMARILAEPGRQVAAVLRAYAEKDTIAEAA
jgi:large subunit ribosomal protein L10